MLWCVLTDVICCGKFFFSRQLGCLGRVASLMRSIHGVRSADPRQCRAAAAANTARAKELYGLGVLDAGVHSVAGSITRFLVLSRNPMIASPTDPRPHKTSLAFALPEGPSRLYEALSVFGLRNLDICKARGDLLCLCSRAVPQSAPQHNRSTTDMSLRALCLASPVCSY